MLAYEPRDLPFQELPWWSSEAEGTRRHCLQGSRRAARVGALGRSHVHVRCLHERHVHHTGLGQCDTLLREVERPVETAGDVEDAPQVVERCVVLVPRVRNEVAINPHVRADPATRFAARLLAPALDRKSVV